VLSALAASRAMDWLTQVKDDLERKSLHGCICGIRLGRP
jgi:hypothetical protein